MGIEPSKLFKAFGLSTALAVSAPAAAKAEQGVGYHGWDDSAKAEFTIPNVKTDFTTGEPSVVRDVHIDCDLLVKDGGARHYTTGFAIQFNAETDRTYELLGPEVVSQLQSWRGQLDYRSNRVKGTIVHLEGAHGISRYTLKDARQTCISDHPDHGYDINTLGQNVEGIHPEYQ